MISSIIVKLISGGVLIISILGYYAYSQNKIEVLTEENITITESNRVAHSTILYLEEYSELQSDELISLSMRLDKSVQKSVDLRSKLDRHDLTRLAISKPKMIEKRINAATLKLFEDMEKETTNE